MRRVRQRIKQLFDVLVQQRVPRDASGEVFIFSLGRQFTVDEQIGDLEECRVLSQLLNRVAPVAQDALVTINVGDFAAR